MRTREKIDDAILAEDIRSLSEKIGRVPRQEDYKKDGTFGLNTLLLRKSWNQWLTEIFGQINEVRKTKRERATALEVLLDIKCVCDKLGKPPTQAEYKVAGKHPLGTILRHRKWNDWLKLATGSVNYNRTEDSKTRRIGDQDLADDVRRVATELGHAPTRSEYNEHGRHSSDTIVVRMPWMEFIQKVCGLEPSKIASVNRSKATNEELLAQLKRLATTLDRTPLKEDLGGQNGFCYTAYVRAFGTFGNALVAAGLINPLNRYCVPREELVVELKRVYGLLGHTPSETEFLENSPIRSNGSIYSEFGSWTKAFLAAGIPVIKARNISVDDIKIALQKWHTANNGDDSCLEYWKIRKAKKNKQFPYSPNSVSAKFHPLSWEEIMRECGFPNYVTKDRYVTGRKRGDHTGADGNEYLSSLEKEIGDFLFELKGSGNILDYEYEAKICPDKNWTCDFKVTMRDGRAVWLEADGLRNNRNRPYSSGNNEKIAFYGNNGMDCRIVSYSSPNIRWAVADSLALPLPVPTNPRKENL